MIDNIKDIKELLNFEKGYFYMLYIFKRKKDQPIEDREGLRDCVTIKSYSIESVEYLDRKYDEIKKLCEIFNARAYIEIQKKSYSDVTLEVIHYTAEEMKKGRNITANVFDSAAGRCKSKDKKWVVDVDRKDNIYLNEMMIYIENNCPPYKEKKILSKIETKSGYHLITQRFDVLKFKEKYSEEIKKSNPTVLYINE